MIIIRVSRDYEALRRYFLAIIAQPKSREDIPKHYMEWIYHLIMIKNLAEANPSITMFCSWDESKGLALIADVIREVEGMISCPRCKRKTRKGFTCEKCGLKLSSE